MYYQMIKAGKENIGLVWDYKGKKQQIRKIYLPASKSKLLSQISGDFPAINQPECKIKNGADRLIAELYKGKKRKVILSMMDMKILKPFQRQVLQQTCRIPRGKVATYSGLAEKVGKPGAARAVGTVMANNPFPIVIPCHRVIRADGTLGGFGGGLEMKKKMLKSEGVKIDSLERVGAGFRRA
ncbi:MAG: MGMT family protein [Syntrophaceae bacterium]|nr:MGMT family protein [Syntrophaceae bacterium]